MEIQLTNEGNAVVALRATVTDVDFSVEEGSIQLIKTNGVPAPVRARRAGLKAHSQRN